MPKTYFEPINFTELSNKELLKKQEDIENKLSKAASSGMIPQDIVESMEEMSKIIDAEVDARLDDGRMDEDELEEDF